MATTPTTDAATTPERKPVPRSIALFPRRLTGVAETTLDPRSPLLTT